jgi:hypothetical protein
MGKGLGKSHKLNMRCKHTEVLMKNLAIGFVLGQNDGKCVIINYRTLKIVPVTQQLYKDLRELPFHYLMHYGVFGMKNRDSSRGYMELKVEYIGTRCLQSDLAAKFNERHQEMLKTFNKERFITAGWFTTIVDVDLTEEHIARVFEALGAWNVPDQHNEECNTSNDPTS